ncbi:UNVERIFIED_CONTAM: hypothetical protein H355_011926 [Colinus virginianus]|nr:hypothetical protein H355_011926 [Colinus virginianus]
MVKQVLLPELCERTRLTGSDCPVLISSLKESVMVYMLKFFLLLKLCSIQNNNNALLHIRVYRSNTETRRGNLKSSGKI